MRQMSEVLGSINAAAREKLDNLILIINCNLQRLDELLEVTARLFRNWKEPSEEQDGK